MKSFLLKFVQIIILAMISNYSFGQTIITINACDTTITDPSLNLPLGNYIITVKSTQNSRMSYNIEQFNQNYGDISIYDGLNSGSPLITTLTDPLISGQKFGGQSSGSAITFTFFTSGPSSTLPHFKIRLRCVQTPLNYPVFQPLKGLNSNGNIQSGDYDNDGDLDVLIGGKIFRNDSYFDSSFKFERKPNVLNGWTNVKMCSADFDNDGFKDIFITGTTTILGGVLSPKAAIYKNNGNGQFTLVTTQTFIGAARGGCSIVDFNNDGKLDICYTGSTDYFLNSTRIFKIYLNNGSMNFTDANIVLPGISGLINASIDWNDSDGDGDKDLIINGHDGNTNITKLLIRNGNSFTNGNVNFSNTSNGSLAWVDVNKDGKQDIINRGVATPDNVDAIVPEIFINTGNNNFNKIISNLPKLYGGGMDWADYDNDNDMDVAINGVNVSGGNGSDAAVYKNNGNGQFTRININGAIADSRIKWFDFNQDGKIDIILAGGYITGSGGYFIKNMGADSFKISSFALTANRYNEGAVAIEDFDNNGRIDILIAGSGLSDVDCNANNSSTLIVGRSWRLSGIPILTEVADLTTANPNPPPFSHDYYWKWGDFDSDGKLDVILTTELSTVNYSTTGGEYFVVYKNNGNNNFTLLFNSLTNTLPNLPLSTNFVQASVIDINKDGINELFLPSTNTVYKRNNNQWVLSSSNPISPNIAYDVSYIDFGDFNGDGFKDLAINSHGNAVSFFHNDTNGKFVFDTTCNNYGIHSSIQFYRQIKWCDLDNDSDLDLIGTDGTYENKNGHFTSINCQLPPQIHTAVGDFNGDGYKDLININPNGQFGSIKVYYNEQGSHFFNEQEVGYPTNTTGGDRWDRSVVSFDIDNDGDDDFVYSAPLCNSGSAIVVNEGNFNNRIIHVISPNGGENYTINTNKTITWYGNQIGNNVKLEISRDSGSTWQILASSVPSSTTGGNYVWNVSSPTSIKCLIKITDNSNVIFSDKSNEIFTISAPSIPIANAGVDTLICLGKSVQIGVSSVATNIYSWTSDIGNFTSSIANPIVSPSTTTKYYLTVSNGILFSKDTVIVTVSSVQINLQDTLLNACIGNSYSIGVANQQALNYQWSSIPIGFTSTLSNPLINPIINTKYFLLARNNTTGCSKNAFVNVIVDSCLIHGITIFPNPANHIITIKLEQNNTPPNYFTLLNSIGSIVLNKELLTVISNVDVSPFSSGLYFYNIKSHSGQILKSGNLLIVH